MDNVYGEACLPFIRFVIKHRDWVRRQLVAARTKFNLKVMTTTKNVSIATRLLLR